MYFPAEEGDFLAETANKKMSAAEIADAVKFSTLGLSFGVVTGGLTEWMANEVVDALGLPGTHKYGDTAETTAEVLVRGAVGAVAYIFAVRFFSQINSRRDDPTEGTYFTYGFGTAQRNLYEKTLHLAGIISSGAVWGAKAPGGSCCDDCADGKKCSG